MTKKDKSIIINLMSWIIWTIGWFLVASLEEYLYLRFEVSLHKNNDYLDASWRIMKLGIWFIGMVKFW